MTITLPDSHACFSQKSSNFPKNSIIDFFTTLQALPLPILYAAQLLDGYSESRAFIGAIEELQSMGIPTGAMPSGAPNFDLLGKDKDLL